MGKKEKKKNYFVFAKEDTQTNSPYQGKGSHHIHLGKALAEALPTNQRNNLKIMSFI